MSITSPSAAQLTSTTSKLEKEGRRRKRRSGGPGKKGKVFLEDRAGLLSLIDKVTNTQDEKTENKLSRVKNVVHGEEEEASTLRKEKGKEDKEKRKVEKEMALIRVKEAIKEKSKEKKRMKKEQPPTNKKRVGFAS